MNRESPGYALLVAALVALACSALVAAAVHWLRPLRADDSMLLRAHSVVTAAGLLPREEADEERILDAFRSLQVRFVEPGSARLQVLPAGHTYDPWPDTGTQARPLLPVYLAFAGERLERVVFAVEGPGMWSAIRGFVALDGELQTIIGITVHAHGETPGIGDRIEAPAWLDKFQGRSMFSADGRAALRVVRDANARHEVDLISGASVTSIAVGELVRNAFGEQAYGPLVARLRAERGP